MEPEQQSAGPSDTAVKRKKQHDPTKLKRRRTAIACLTCRRRKEQCDGQRPCGKCAGYGRADTCCYPEGRSSISILPATDNPAGASLPLSAVSYTPPNLVPLSLPPMSHLTFPTQHLFPLENSHIAFPQVNPQHSLAQFQQPYQAPLDGSPHSAGTETTPQQQPHSQLHPKTQPSSPSDSSDANEDASDVEAAAGAENLLTLVASPVVGSSSTGTLVKDVESATKRLTGLAITKLAKPRRKGDSEQPNVFAFGRRTQELYSLPHRSLSDRLIQAYEQRVHPILPILHWPSFMQTYESTFSSSADPDKRFLGLLNQMYAIACQVGGTGILPGEEFQYGVSFYQRSLAIMYPLVLQAESILALQCVLLMGTYLQSINQPTLCWNTVGHAVRFALVQGLHLPSTYRKLGTIEAEVRRRAYAGALSLEATTAATLGLPPTLLPNTDISPTSAFNDGSTANFFSLSHALYGVQLQIIHELYNGKPTLHESTLRLERQLDTLALSIPAELHLPVSTGRPSYSGSIYQALVLQTRLLNTRQLLHRPLLSSLSRGDRADHDGSTKIHTQLEVMMARASARLCCDAAVKMLEIVADGETSYLKGPWWYQMYYVYSASFAVLACFLVDLENPESALYCIGDTSRAAAALSAAQRFLSSSDPPPLDSIVPHLPSPAARAAAAQCLKSIIKSARAISHAPTTADDMRTSTLRSALRTTLTTPFPMPATGNSSDDGQRTDFFELLSSIRNPTFGALPTDSMLFDQTTSLAADNASFNAWINTEQSNSVHMGIGDLTHDWATQSLFGP